MTKEWARAKPISSGTEIWIVKAAEHRENRRHAYFQESPFSTTNLENLGEALIRCSWMRNKAIQRPVQLCAEVGSVNCHSSKLFSKEMDSIVYSVGVPQWNFG
jgi:hypothetical protein